MSRRTVNRIYCMHLSKNYVLNIPIAFHRTILIKSQESLEKLVRVVETFKDYISVEVSFSPC